MKDKNLSAIFYMLAAVILYATAPVFLYIGEANNAPFLFNTIRLLFLTIGTFVFLLLFYKKELFNIDIWKILIKNWRKITILGMLIGLLSEYPMLSWSINYIDVSVASVLYKTWPFFMILLAGKMFKKEKRYDTVNNIGWCGIIIGIAGMAFVVLSQHEKISIAKENDELIIVCLSFFFAILSGGMGALIASSCLLWCHNVMKDFKNEPRLKFYKKEDCKNLEIFFMSLIMTLMTAISFIINIVSFVIFGYEESITNYNFIIAAIFGFFISSSANIFFRIAHIKTNRLEINALSYAGPLFSLIFLSIMGYVNVEKIEWIAIGTIIIIISNTLLYFKNKIPLIYQYLSLVFCIIMALSQI